jgi:hypothetical protein
MWKKITRAPFDATLLRQGYLAGRRGFSGGNNPYPAGTREALAWGIGWINGQRKQLRVVGGGCPPAPGSLRAKPRF